MRIKTHSVADFIKNLEGHKVYNDAVFVDLSKQPLNGNGPRDATSWLIILHATAILDFTDGGQALLELGKECGIDRETEGEIEGTREWNLCEEDIIDFCDSNGLTVKPGVIDM